jgi:Flp pilus assembly protein TadD
MAKKRYFSEDEVPIFEKLNVLEMLQTPTTQVNESKSASKKKRLTFSEKRKKLAENKKKKVKKQNLKGISPSDEELNNLLLHYQNGRFSDAEKLAISITQEFPEHQFGWKVLGAVLGQSGRQSKAVNANQTAVALSPQDAEAHSNLGIALQELGRFDEAEASYKQAIEFKPNYAEAHNNLGITLQELGRFDEAATSYKQAIEFKPNYAEAHNNLGNTLKELGRLDEAEASYKQAIELKPNYAEAHSNLGGTLKELGRLDEAATSHTQAIALKPDYAEAHNNLGNTLKELEKLDEAEASYKQAIVLKPDYAEAHSNLANTLQELGRLDEAEVSCRQAIALKPDLAEAHSNLGTIFYGNGNIDAAIESLAKANDIDPKLRISELVLSVLRARKAREKAKANIANIKQSVNNMELIPNPLILHRSVEPELVANLYDINTRELDKTTDERFGNGKTSDWNLFDNNLFIMDKVVDDLIALIKKAFNSDIFIQESFFNILSAGSGSNPHTHLTALDKNIGLNLASQKHVLQYYLRVGDQSCSEPGIYKLYEPNEEILPSEGMVIIIPAGRRHSAVYGGKTDRVMIGIDFYSLGIEV